MRVKKSFNKQEKMRRRDRTQQHITAGNWLLPEGLSLWKIFEPVLKPPNFLYQISQIFTRKMNSEHWKKS